MKEIKIRYSKQRVLIFNNLKHRYDHPTAEMIYQDLKVDYPHLSLGTVYRNLNQLVETKQIKKLDLGDTMVHYDGNIQRGSGSSGVDAPVTVVAIGLTTGQYVKSTGTITKSTANTVSLVAALERNYSNPS